MSNLWINLAARAPALEMTMNLHTFVYGPTLDFGKVHMHSPTGKETFDYC